MRQTQDSSAKCYLLRLLMTIAEVNNRHDALLMFLPHDDGLADVQHMLVVSANTDERRENLAYELLGASVQATWRKSDLNTRC